MRAPAAVASACACALALAACSFVNSGPQDASGALRKEAYVPPPDMAASGPTTLMPKQACFQEGNPCGAPGQTCCAGFICAGFRDPVCLRGT